jgi:hypothetical protein
MASYVWRRTGASLTEPELVGHLKMFYAFYACATLTEAVSTLIVNGAVLGKWGFTAQRRRG